MERLIRRFQDAFFGLISSVFAFVAVMYFGNAGFLDRGDSVRVLGFSSYDMDGECLFRKWARIKNPISRQRFIQHSPQCMSLLLALVHASWSRRHCPTGI